MKLTSAARHILIYLASTYSIVLAIALAFPHRGIAPLLTMLAPVVSVAITITLATPAGERRAAWTAIGWRCPPMRALALALFLPAGLAVASFGMARVIGIARFPGLQLTLDGALTLVVTLAVGCVLALGEEIGWRGFLYPRLATLLPRGRAAILTGIAHAVFHLPLLLLTTAYQSAGKRWIVVPMLMITITAAGVIYAWLRDYSGGTIWPVAFMHNAFNTFMEMGAGLSVAGSAAALSYATTETGAFSMLLALLVAGWLLTGAWRPAKAHRSGSHALPPAAAHQ